MKRNLSVYWGISTFVKLTIFQINLTNFWIWYSQIILAIILLDYTEFIDGETQNHSPYLTRNLYSTTEKIKRINKRNINIINFKKVKKLITSGIKNKTLLFGEDDNITLQNDQTIANIESYTQQLIGIQTVCQKSVSSKYSKRQPWIRGNTYFKLKSLRRRANQDYRRNQSDFNKTRLRTANIALAEEFNTLKTRYYNNMIGTNIKNLRDFYSMM